MTGLELIYAIKENFESNENKYNNIESCFNKLLSMLITYLSLNGYKGEIPKNFIEYINFLKNIPIGKYVKDNTIPIEFMNKTILDEEYRISKEIYILFNGFNKSLA